MSFFPTDPKKIKTRIRSYERSLKKENARDGYGKRFLVGPLYLLLDDHEGALKYYDWYLKVFLNDGIEPPNHATWALALYRSGKVEEAKQKLIETCVANMHVWDWIADGKMTKWDMWYGSNWAEPNYFTETAPEYLELWQFEEIQWAEEISMSDQVKKLMDELFSIRKKLKDLPVGPERSQLVTRLFQISSDYQEQSEQSENIIPFPTGGLQ